MSKKISKCEANEWIIKPNAGWGKDWINSHKSNRQYQRCIKMPSGSP